MYAKLVFKNAKRSVKEYLVYLVTMTICVALFYSFLSISSRYYQPDIGVGVQFQDIGRRHEICSLCSHTAAIVFD